MSLWHYVTFSLWIISRMLDLETINSRQHSSRASIAIESELLSKYNRCRFKSSASRQSQATVVLSEMHAYAHALMHRAT